MSEEHRTNTAEELRAVERRRLGALVAGDIAVAEPLHAETYQLVTPTGHPLSKADYLGGIASGAMRYHVFAPVSDIDVLVGVDLGVVRYRCRIEVDVGGRVSRLEAWHTDVYERSDEGWRAVWSQATAIA